MWYDLHYKLKSNFKSKNFIMSFLHKKNICVVVFWIKIYPVLYGMFNSISAHFKKMFLLTLLFCIKIK